MLFHILFAPYIHPGSICTLKHFTENVESVFWDKTSFLNKI